MKKKLKSWIFILLLQFTWLPLYVFAPEAQQQVQEETVEEEWDLIRWKQDTYEETLEVSVEE